MRADLEDSFREFTIARAGSLRRTAYFLCGDWALAEDLVQEALTRVYLAWPRLARRDRAAGYARQVLIRLMIDWRRGRRATPVAAVPDEVGSSHRETETRLMLLNALAQMPIRQRAAVVLRYWEDLSVP